MKNGFTLIELLVVITIVLLITTIGIAYYNQNNQELSLRTEAKKLVDIIELAKKKAQSSDLITTPNPTPSYCSNFTGYSVNLTTSGYTLNYLCNNTTTVNTYSFPTNISYTGNTYDFIFPPLGRGTNITTNTITLINTIINKHIDITISNNGIIQITDTLY